MYLIEGICKITPVQPPIFDGLDYDSKTELMDHKLRAAFINRLPIAAALRLVLGVLGLADGFLKPSSDIAFFIGIGLSIPHIIIVAGVGANFIRGRNTSAHPGSGLGLAIVRRIVERHGG